MRRVLKFVRDNRRIIIIVTLLVVLIAAVYFINKKSDGKTQTSAAYVQKSDTEVKLGKILSSIEGVGKTDVMITEEDGKIAGEIIVCDGADNIMTRNNILNAVSTALNIEKNIIVIYSMTV